MGKQWARHVVIPAAVLMVAVTLEARRFVDELWRIEGTVPNDHVPPDGLVVLVTEGGAESDDPFA